MEIFERHVQEALSLYDRLRGDEMFSAEVAKAFGSIILTIKNGGTVFVVGNGGSAAEAQHLSAEIVGRYKKERKALPSIALTTDTSILTAIANDYSFSTVFSRQVDALAKKGDVLILLSTSGNSDNLVQAVSSAKQREVLTVGLLGKNGGALGSLVDIAVIVPSDDTPRIQEVHLMLVHALSERIEDECV